MTFRYGMMIIAGVTKKMMMPQRIRITFGACFGLLLMTFSGVAAQDVKQTPFRYYIKINGKDQMIEKIILNGAVVLTGSYAMHSVPLRIDRFLKEGNNDLGIIYYSSNSEKEFQVMIERREKGSPPKAVVVAQFSCKGDKPEFKSETCPVRFTIQEMPVIQEVNLAQQDKNEITFLLKRFHQSLTQKDKKSVTAFFDRCLNEESLFEPETMSFFKNVMDMALSMINNPAFKMKPLNVQGIQYAVKGDVVYVSRPDKQSLVESQELKTKEEGFTSTSRINMESLPFKKYDGQWFVCPSVL